MLLFVYYPKQIGDDGNWHYDKVGDAPKIEDANESTGTSCNKINTCFQFRIFLKCALF